MPQVFLAFLPSTPLWNLSFRSSLFSRSIISFLTTNTINGHVTETSCDGGYVHNSTCYKIHSDRVRWFTAVNRCLSNNASLTVFDDDYIFVTEDILNTTGPLWVGLVKSWWTWSDDG